MERIWGGRRLELLGKNLPGVGPIGESWEIVDREEAQSVVHTGPLRGQMMRELWADFREPIFGHVTDRGRFPLLFKLLDARERLSVQVHPPERIAVSLHGEPKSEMWYIVENYGEGDIFVGLEDGTNREVFERALGNGTVERVVHRIEVHSGDAMFIPSGRVHAIGAGNVIFEVQQNSDTTYRVFDWNRVGLDGKMRELHIDQSLQSINFDDREPMLLQPQGETIVQCDYFRVDKWELDRPRESVAEGTFAVFTCLTGNVRCGETGEFGPGDFFLVPANMSHREIAPLNGHAQLLRTTVP
jgi:mannose-6-phosphate isomerase